MDPKKIILMPPPWKIVKRTWKVDPFFPGKQGDKQGDALCPAVEKDVFIHFFEAEAGGGLAV